MSIALQQVNHVFDDVTALADVTFEVEEAEIVCVLGPSGSGKSTLLKLIAGLESLQQGFINISGLKISAETNPPPEDRPAGLVFQEHALFPHLSVADNVAFGLSKLTSDEKSSRVAELLKLTGLESFADRFPHTLSGGQQQRVALARSLAAKPAVMLMDEPFASIDVLLRKQLRIETRNLLKETGMTSLIVTHDPEDALQIADRIAVIVSGELVQYDTPEALWHHPAHPFVAEVFASRQLIDGRVTEGGYATPFCNIDASKGSAHQADSAVTVAVDPAQVTLRSSELTQEVSVTISDIRFAGDHYRITLIADSGEELTIRSDAVAHSPGDQVSVEIASETVVAYDRE